MSEKEKKKRAKYQKNRSLLIIAQSVIAAMLTLSLLVSLFVSYQLDKTQYINYRESGNIDYDVYLKENDYFEEDRLEQGQSYVASLIDQIIANMSYEIDMDADDVNYRYSYKVTSRLEIIDNKSNRAILNDEKVLKDVQNKAQKSETRLIISENVVINYDEYNDVANRFLAQYDLPSTTSNIVVTLEVDVLSDSSAFASNSAESYRSELRIPLTTKTVNIEMTSNVPDAEIKTIASAGGSGSEIFKAASIVLGIIDAIVILIMIAFILLTRTDDITYTARVKKIVNQYKSYIQKIKNVFDTYGYQIIQVETFDELLEIRDTIQSPILMHENEDKTCAKFIIPTDNKLLYFYEIKIEGYTDPEPEKRPEPQPTTIVKPNITNVVRPVVKVVVNPKLTETVVVPEVREPEAEIETFIEEPEVEIEAAEEIPEVEVITEEIAEEPVEESVEETDAEEEPAENIEDLQDILNTIPSVEEIAAEQLVVEAPGVDAIDVVWQERKDKRYRYDPDGNVVEEGDVVLVPTRDVHSDREVIREAEVARGNYKIDPEELSSPLKKIIGVVRRKAEKAFVAMITPDEKDFEENTDSSEN